MKNQTKSVFGIYQDWSDVQVAVDQFKLAGIANHDISVLVYAENQDKDALSPERHTHAPRGVEVGAVSGAAIGGGLGVVAGLGLLVVPGIGPMLAFGPILTALAGIGMGGAAGSIVGAFIGVGFPRHKAHDLHHHLREGAILVSAHVESEEMRQKALDVLEDTRAEEISLSEHERITSVDDLEEVAPSFLVHPDPARDDLIQRKPF